MKISIITFFPSIFFYFKKTSLIGKKIKKKLIKIKLIKLENKLGYKKLDEKPFKDNKSRIIQISTIIELIKKIKDKKKNKKTIIINTDPSGKKFNQKESVKLSNFDHIIIICGRYEGIDSRINFFINENYSIGDYILFGGEIPAMLLIESIIRNVILKKKIIEDESFYNKILEKDNYSKPYKFLKFTVPVLKKKNNIEKTKSIRPDLIRKFVKKN